MAMVRCKAKKKKAKHIGEYNYVLTPHSIFGVIIDEKAVVTKIGICHGCLTYFEGLSFWPGRSNSWQYFQVGILGRNVKNQRYIFVYAQWLSL